MDSPTSSPVANIKLDLPPLKENKPILTVFSSAEDGFESKYDLLEEIGRGGFSVVYRCRDKLTSEIYAVKIIDLRPLRLRERFNPMRLRREVDIIRRLHHENIIQFIAVFETADQLLMVLEYCPGQELFDVILSKKSFTEVEAKPIFVQIAKAIHYLHSMNILHRDIKPENVLILNEPNKTTGLPIAKLLDFGLSKNAGISMAKTFVGTPCYLAPEVEYTSKGIGGTYGLPADCWSLGAVLHVMLVSRFPEFQRDPVTGSVGLHLPTAQWSHVSESARDLIRSLMVPNPSKRMTAEQCLQHPWLEQYALHPNDLRRIATKSNEDFQAKGGAAGLADMERDDDDSDNVVIKHSGIKGADDAHLGMTMVTRIQGQTNTTGRQVMVNDGGISEDPEALPIAPLLHLQRSIATCFEEAHASYKDMPEVASQVRRGATMCRSQLVESVKMLRKIDQTATSVLDMFPDLELAVEEGEPTLAIDFFNMVKGWVVELKELVRITQEANKASMDQIQGIVENSSAGIENMVTSLSIKDSPIKSVDKKNILQTHIINTLQDMSNATAGGDVDLSEEEVLGLFMDLFGKSTSSVLHQSVSTIETTDADKNMDTQSNLSVQSEASRFSSSSKRPGAIGIPQYPPAAASTTDVVKKTPPSSPLAAAAKLQDALEKLRQVDIILEHLGLFWANTEIVLEVLTKKGQHAEQFIAFAHKPRLLARFQERMHEYRDFWDRVRSMCHNYISGVNEDAVEENRGYNFLDKGEESNSGSAKFTRIPTDAKTSSSKSADVSRVYSPGPLGSNISNEVWENFSGDLRRSGTSGSEKSETYGQLNGKTDSADSIY